MSIALAGRRIGLLTPWASRAGGGVFEAVVLQAGLIRDAGGTPVIVSLDDPDARADEARLAPAEVVRLPGKGPGFFGYAPGFADRLEKLDLDLLHLHGIWMYPSHAGARWAARTGRPYVISPHGMMDPWITGRGRWKKALARLGYERGSWRAASLFHALTEAEARDIAGETGRTGSAVIPNPAPPTTHGDHPVPGPHVVYIGRIHEKKNLQALAQGWIDAQRQGRLPPGAKLSVAGWGEQDEIDNLQSLLNETADSAQFLGPVFGAEKDALLASARYVILPSHSEGLPMAMLEAWSMGRPTLMTPDCNLPEGFAARAAIDCGHAADEIAATLGAALAMEDAAWQEMSRNALSLADGPFAAETVRRRWAECYAKLMQDAGRA